MIKFDQWVSAERLTEEFAEDGNGVMYVTPTGFKLYCGQFAIEADFTEQNHIPSYPSEVPYKVGNTKIRIVRTQRKDQLQ